MKYLLPKELGGGEVEIVHMLTDKGDGRTASVRVLPTGPQFEIHMNWLTPAPTPQPAEPPPGAYQIGEQLCVHAASDDDDDHWFVDREGTAWFSWPELWERFGGPDVTIQRLVALPTVSLHWFFEDPSGYAVTVYKTGNISTTAPGGQGGASVAMTPRARREMAAALLAVEES